MYIVRGLSDMVPVVEVVEINVSDPLQSIVNAVAWN